MSMSFVDYLLSCLDTTQGYGDNAWSAKKLNIKPSWPRAKSKKGARERSLAAPRASIQ
jgi:hypothetical protein